jgi:hypothetical protein
LYTNHNYFCHTHFSNAKTDKLPNNLLLVLIPEPMLVSVLMLESVLMLVSMLMLVSVLMLVLVVLMLVLVMLRQTFANCDAKCWPATLKCNGVHRLAETNELSDKLMLVLVLVLIPVLVPNADASVGIIVRTTPDFRELRHEILTADPVMRWSLITC